MPPLVSVIIPNHNGGRSLKKCLAAAFASRYDNFEVVVVDDCSTDQSLEIITSFPCRAVSLTEHGGASKARNTGAENSRGEILFFLDADCILLPDTLEKAVSAITIAGDNTIIGGTYTPLPHDHDFFSIFQSVFINYSETKNLENPDYIATHAMVISKKTFNKIGGFDEEFLPIIEDVEFCHRARRQGFRLRMQADILVRHIFHFSFGKSLRNAVRKSKYWIIYSLGNKDLLADSGTASVEFKLNVIACFLVFFLLAGAAALKAPAISFGALPLLGINLFLNRKLFAAFYSANRAGFAVKAVLYYTMLYPLAVGLGAAAGIIEYRTGKYR